MHGHPGSPLKVSCPLSTVDGSAPTLITLAELLPSVGSTTDSELYPYIDQIAQTRSNDLTSSDKIMAIFPGFVFVTDAIAIVIPVIDLTVGILELSRSQRPEKYRFFLGWRISLLVIGGIGTLLTGVVAPNGAAPLVCGVAVPTLFIIGGVQQNKVYSETHTLTP